MNHNQKRRQNYPKLAIHSTDNSFGFGLRKKNNLESDELFIKNSSDSSLLFFLYPKPKELSVLCITNVG